VVKRGEQAGVAVHPQRFRHHFSHTWLARGGAGGDLMQLNGWSTPQMLTWYGASAAGARARSNYGRIMKQPAVTAPTRSRTWLRPGRRLS
jgi:hypothetical protein